MRLSRLAALLLCIAVAACSSAGTRNTITANATLHLYVSEDPHSLNPILYSLNDEAKLGLLTFDTLVQTDPQNHFIPDLATVVPTVANGGISRDGLRYTFHLHHGVRWQDGAPFSSADVAFTVKTVLDPKVNVVIRSGYDRIARVQTPNADTVVFILKTPFAPFMATVGYGFPIVPKHLLEHSADFNKDPFGSHPIGTGPYKFVQWSRGDRLRYVANDNYFLGKPKIRTIDIPIIPDVNTVGIEFRQHQIDTGIVESSMYAQLQGVNGLITRTYPYNDFNALVLNLTHPILQDVRVRRAIAMAIDRESIVKKNTHGTGTPAYADLPAFLWTSALPPNPVAYNPAGARALLDAAGWRVGPGGIRTKNGQPLRLDGIDFSGSVTGRNLDVQYQQMLRAAGIQISWKYYSTSLYYAPASAGGPLNRGDFDVGALSFVGSVDPENDELYTCANRAPAGFNFARYCSATMDALQAASLRETDPAKRLKLVAQIEKLAVTDVPYVFTYHTPYRLIAQPTLHRTAPNLSTDWYDAWEWTK